MSDEGAIQPTKEVIFDLTHSGTLAAHLGSQRTFVQLKTSLLAGAEGNVVWWCRECEMCAQWQDATKENSQSLLGTEEGSQSWGTLSLNLSLFRVRRDIFLHKYKSV